MKIDKVRFLIKTADQLTDIYQNIRHSIYFDEPFGIPEEVIELRDKILKMVQAESKPEDHGHQVIIGLRNHQREDILKSLKIWRGGLGLESMSGADELIDIVDCAGSEL